MLARRFARFVFPLSLALAVPALGCGGSVASGQPVTADSVTTRAPVAQGAHGQLKLLGTALGDVPLTRIISLEEPGQPASQLRETLIYKDREAGYLRYTVEGVGPAGMGHYYGKYGFDMLTHAKSMLISPPDVAIDHLFPPYTPEKNKALKMWFEY